MPAAVLFEEAKAEPIRRPERSHRETIVFLKDKRNFTFREIARWLRERGVPCDNNAVYREYTRDASNDVDLCMLEHGRANETPYVFDEDDSEETGGESPRRRSASHSIKKSGRGRRSTAKRNASN